MKTWLTVDNNHVYRHNEYGDEPQWIGCIEFNDHNPSNRWFTMYGDNRTLNVSELQQILGFL
jgi:hypothetical protein